MDKKDIDNGLTGHFISSGLAFAFPNVKAKHERPFIELQIQPTGREDTTLKGGGILREFGLVNAVVVSEVDEGTDPANELAQQIAELFPPATRISITGGVIEIINPPDIRGGFREGSEWRVPVIIRYQARAE